MPRNPSRPLRPGGRTRGRRRPQAFSGPFLLVPVSSVSLAPPPRLPFTLLCRSCATPHLPLCSVPSSRWGASSRSFWQEVLGRHVHQETCFTSPVAAGSRAPARTRGGRAFSVRRRTPDPTPPPAGEERGPPLVCVPAHSSPAPSPRVSGRLLLRWAPLLVAPLRGRFSSPRDGRGPAVCFPSSPATAGVPAGSGCSQKRACFSASPFSVISERSLLLCSGDPPNTVRHLYKSSWAYFSFSCR